MTEAPKTSPIEFGTDEWGKWAAGVQERLAGLEANAHVPVDLSPLTKRLDALEKAMASKGAKVAASSVVGNGDVENRLGKLERITGLASENVPFVDDVGGDAPMEGASS